MKRAAMFCSHLDSWRDPIAIVAVTMALIATGIDATSTTTVRLSDWFTLGSMVRHRGRAERRGGEGSIEAHPIGFRSRNGGEGADGCGISCVRNEMTEEVR